MSKKVTVTAFLVAFLCCLSALAVSDNKGKANDVSGCHPILNIRGNDAEPFFATDCTACIDCTIRFGNTCSAIANCSDDYILCLQSSKCPTIGCSCTNNSTHIGCECDCTGTGVDCSWTDQNGAFHEVTKNCPDNLP